MDDAASGRLRSLVAPDVILLVTLLVAIINLIPDYLSLLETRWVISRMNVTGAIGGFLALDLVATAFVSLIPWLVFLVLLGPIPLNRFFSEFIVGALTFEGMMILATAPPEAQPLPTGIWFYSAFFTSVWVWLYALAGVAVRLGGRAAAWMDRLKSVMDVKEKPFRSMGLAAMVIVTVVFLAALPFAAL